MAGRDARLNNRELGRQGEEKAAAYLKKRGYKILAQNYHTRYGELDIVCKTGDNLVFVEVKTRRGTNYGSPEEAITAKKMEHLRKAAAVYLESVKPGFKELRFDVVAILIENEKEQINHIKYAF